ncbi:hypothetical protein BGZ63DRAFT_386672 [Mariannaea sp. PMI_226]|nr:hypothetical protein BGZ63DRAFT_386672 [Mariannaea sp. PMI_226]
MKLVVAGATGFVATEVIRQALSAKAITSLVALARRPTPVPSNLGVDADTKKFKSVVCDDFNNYSEEVKRDLEGTDCVIWLIAITPTKSKTMPWDEVYKICHDYTLTGLKTFEQLHGTQKTAPLRFIYTSGANAERDASKKPFILGEYTLMRGKVESAVLQHAKDSQGALEGIVIKPGLINAAGGLNVFSWAIQAVGRSIISLPVIRVDEVAAALISLASRGSEKDTLLNEDLIRLSQDATGQE